ENASGTPPSLARTLEITAVRESMIFDFTVEIAQAQTPPNTAATVAAVKDSRRLFCRAIDREPEPRAAEVSALSTDEPRSGPETRCGGACVRAGARPRRRPPRPRVGPISSDRLGPFVGEHLRLGVALLLRRLRGLLVDRVVEELRQGVLIDRVGLDHRIEAA